ncbi:ATP-dependent nuclease [Pontiella agarivorans]|uniref:AAA family ATPase n=1 Tax=Pontiella agarivorans TaxID=3038953 RepID=A0ABU5MTP5_9BACT|nr:AAA family ATPase [Pontiella agarivorans]MDZ8117517.1 AAA family ATPase [Pontiella agarivorans]
MRIDKINIENFRCFRGKFTLKLNEGVNVLVGDNEAGKSTILEAVNLGLSGVLNGKYLKNQLSPYLFNHQVVDEYIASLNTDQKKSPPHILIEIFFADDFPLFEGNGNSERLKASGLSLKVEFDPDYKSEYEVLVSSGGVLSIPVEYYRVSWKSFARESVTGRSIPLKSVLIDSTSNRYQNGSDVYISRIIRDDLDDMEKVGLSQAHRRLKEAFGSDKAVAAINKKVNDKAKVSNKKLHVSVDLSSHNSWETSLMVYLNETPFQQIGKGEQCIVKTNLALAHQKAQEANIVLLEEPENHLSHSKLNELMDAVSKSCTKRQAIISTHSSFVANKLGLGHLILLKNPMVTRLTDLSPDTYDFFKKLPGYQTLRLILCKKAVLVEGDSDELIFQKAYMKENKGRLPIHDGVDVISVKLTFKRFLEIAVKLEHPIAVITDNDGDYENKIIKKYLDYEEVDYVTIFADKRESLNTLEPQFVDANKSDLKGLCKVIGISSETYDTPAKVRKYMLGSKTTWALRVFEAEDSVKYPDYIQRAVRWCNDK